jgi:hypothetical protein
MPVQTIKVAAGCVLVLIALTVLAALAGVCLYAVYMAAKEGGVGGWSCAGASVFIFAVMAVSSIPDQEERKEEPVVTKEETVGSSDVSDLEKKVAHWMGGWVQGASADPVVTKAFLNACALDGAQHQGALLGMDARLQAEKTARAMYGAPVAAEAPQPRRHNRRRG